MPPMPKDPSTRARRNRTSTSAVLRAVPGAKIPPLPTGFKWLKLTQDWWRVIWKSPMAPEFCDADLPGIQRLAILVNAYYESAAEGDLNLMLKLAAEIRHQQQAYGLTPMDRRRLQWTIEQGEEAEEKTQRRRAAKPKPAAVPAVDPRQLLA